jgi:hypothetical protein
VELELTNEGKPVCDTSKELKIKITIQGATDSLKTSQRAFSY